jgi:hypothetical protein
MNSVIKKEGESQPSNWFEALLVSASQTFKLLTKVTDVDNCKFCFGLNL